MKFKAVTKLKPRGDQPKVIKELTKAIRKGGRFNTLLGVTGSGKTFVMAKVIENLQLPTLVISPNKTLAAQLYEEFKAFFPENSVCYFVSYYDYYQPEAYIPQTDTYIEKDTKINQEIDQLRHQAVQTLLSRKDALIVASVSCIYNLGSPDIYQRLSLHLKRGQKISYQNLLSCLLDLQYERNDYELWRGRFRIRMNYIDVWLSGQDKIVRIKLENEKIKELLLGEIPFGRFSPIDKIEIWPAKFWLTEKERLNIAISNIKLELQERIKELKRKKKFLEAERLKRRTEYDLAMIKETGWCHGIENYSRHLEFRKKGEPPFTLLDYFPSSYLTFIDESHISIPQLRGMYKGDYSRKKTLVEYGFRLPCALDNRPLKFSEFLKKVDKVVFVSATPQQYEKRVSTKLVELIVRPTYLLDPTIEIRPTKNQIKDLIKEIQKRKKRNQRTLVLTLTKRLAEALADHLKKYKIKAEYLHSEIKTLIRPRYLTKLRKGDYDVLVGINLLREGLDLPEVSLIGILDADKEGFLRDETSLIQIMGRAARHKNGHIIMYADRITRSMKKAIKETKRRRKIQESYNKIHRTEPMTVIKPIRETLVEEEKEEERLPKKEFLKEYLKQLKYQLNLARRNLQFKKAAKIKSRIENLIKSK